MLRDEHGLRPGTVIEIRPVWLQGTNESPILKAGETVTLTVFGKGNRFWLRSRHDIEPR